MAENAQTLTRKERAAAPVTGRADKKQGRVTDAEGEQSVLALALRRPKPGTAREAGTWRNLESSAGRRESDLALPCSPRHVIIWASTWQCSINEARGNGWESGPAESGRLQRVGDDPGKPRFQRRFHKPIPRRLACSSS